MRKTFRLPTIMCRRYILGMPNDTDQTGKYCSYLQQSSGVTGTSYCCRFSRG